MARKAKSVVASVESNEAELVAQAEAMLQAEAISDVGEIEEEVVEQSTGPSLVSQLVTQVTEAAEPKATVKVDKNEGVGQFIRKLIGEGLGNKEILAIVHEQYGNKNTTYACVAWYRNKMKKAGQVKEVTTSLDWLQNFAKANGLSEESTNELGKALKVA